jgi:hypothetical protein
MLFFYFFRTSTREEEEEELPCGLVCRMLNFLGVGSNALCTKLKKKKRKKGKRFNKIKKKIV